MKETVRIAVGSAVWPWIRGLMEAAMRRESASDRAARTGRFSLHCLSSDEIRAWALVAQHARGPN